MVAGAIAAVSLALLVGAGVSLAFGLEARKHEKDAPRKKQDAEDAAEREQKVNRDIIVVTTRADVTLREAVKTTASFIALASELEETLGSQPALLLRLLRQTETNLDRLRQAGDSAEVREQQAGLQTLAAKLHLLRGRTDLALPAADAAVAGYDALHQDGSVEARAGLSLALFTRARIHLQRGHTVPARADVRRAQDVANELAAAQPDQVRWTVLRARSRRPSSAASCRRRGTTPKAISSRRRG